MGFEELYQMVGQLNLSIKKFDLIQKIKIVSKKYLL